MARARYAVVEKEDYGGIMCEQCGSGNNSEELLLCDKCDNGFHMKCVRPIVVRIPIGSWICPKCLGTKKVTSKRFIDSLVFEIVLLFCFFDTSVFSIVIMKCVIVFVIV
jgi:ribosomal protein L37AE/L43A